MRPDAPSLGPLLPDRILRPHDEALASALARISMAPLPHPLTTPTPPTRACPKNRLGGIPTDRVTIAEKALALA